MCILELEPVIDGSEPYQEAVHDELYGMPTDGILGTILSDNGQIVFLVDEEHVSEVESRVFAIINKVKALLDESKLN